MDNQQGNLEKEIRKHPNLPIYVSEDGEIYNLRWKKRKAFLHRSGYLRVDVNYEKVRHHVAVHRAVAETFLPAPSSELLDQCTKEHHRKVLVLHKDNDRFNNHYSNLKWGTHQQNILEAFEDGLRRDYSGEGNPAAVLTESVVRQACKFFEEGKSRKQVREILNLTYNQVYLIHTRRSWKHVSEKYKF